MHTHATFHLKKKGNITKTVKSKAQRAEPRHSRAQIRAQGAEQRAMKDYPQGLKPNQETQARVCLDKFQNCIGPIILFYLPLLPFLNWNAYNC